MNDQEKEERIKSYEKRFAKHPNKKKILLKAQQDIYRKDMLQPQQREFREVYRKTQSNLEHIKAAVEREEKRKEKELDEAYRKKPKNIITNEEKILRDLSKENPKMVSEEDIIRWR